MSSIQSQSAFEVRQLASDADRVAWNAFVASLPEGDVLQCWEWAAVKSEWSPLRIAVYRGKDIVAGAQILKRTLPLVGPFYYASRGPLLADWTDHDSFAALLAGIKDQAKKDGAAFLKIDPGVSIERTDVTELIEKSGFKPPANTDAQGFGGTQPRCVMQLDLAGRTEAEVLASFKGQTRRNIKLAADKHGVDVVSDLTRDDLVVFNDLMKVTGERDGFRPRPLSYFQSLWDNLMPAGYLKLFLTNYEGVTLSGALCFIIGDKSWYVYGASSNEHRNVMPNYAMQWAMIRWAHSAGCSWYDFRGVSPRRRQEGESAAEVEKEDHLQGLNRFKEGFGTRYLEYVGEFDLIYKPAQYWIYAQGKPAAQAMMKKIKAK